MRPKSTLSVVNRTFAFLAVASLACGCSPPPSAEEAVVPQSPDSEAVTKAPAASSHDHAHGHGPNGGNLIHLAPSGVHAEWKFDKTDSRFTVFLGDFDEDKLTAAKLVPSSMAPSNKPDSAPPPAIALESSDAGWIAEGPELAQLFNSASAVQLVVTDDEGDHTCELRVKTKDAH